MIEDQNPHFRKDNHVPNQGQDQGQGQGHLQLQHRAAVPHLLRALSLVLDLTLALAQIFANLSRPKLRNAEYEIGHEMDFQ